MPVHNVRCGMSVKRIAEIDQALNRCYVDVIDGREVEYYGAKGRQLFNGRGRGGFRAGVAPEAVLGKC